MFKPNNEEFPFTIEIKDKATGEAMIEVIRNNKDIQNNSNNNNKNNKKAGAAKRSANSILLDCNKRKVYDFLIQAHDCSMPSLSSNK